MITYNPLTPMEMEFIEMFNDNYDLMRFMLCSPHSTDPVLNYGGRLSKVPKKDAFLNSCTIQKIFENVLVILKHIFSFLSVN